MITVEALFKLTYGLYIVSSGDNQKGNGFISNTIFQVTSDPPRFAACCNKENHTAEFITRTGYFSVSVLDIDSPAEIIGRFGFKSGKDFNKMEGMQLHYGESGVPIVMNGSIAYIECKLIQTTDVGTHWLFIGELISAELIFPDKEPLTYSQYRKVRKGFAPKNAPTYIDKAKLASANAAIKKKYKCSACGYIYDDAQEKIKFRDLPADWVCPACGSAKEDFIEITS